MLTFWIILQQEFLMNSKNLAKVFQNLLFFFISFSIFFLISQNQQNQIVAPFLAIDVILFCLIFSLIFSNSEFLYQDFKDGTLEQIIISQPNIEIFILAKMLGNWLTFSLPIILCIPVIGMLIALDKGFMINFFVLILIASLAINFICAFCGSLSMSENKAPLIAILMMPLIIPILLIVCGNMEETSFYSSFKILIGICVFVGSISVLATAKIIRILHD